MMKRLLLTIACLAMAAPLPAQDAPPRQTVQQQFDAGSAALAAGEWQQAFDIFQTLERRLANGNPRSLAVTRVRMASALLEMGRLDDAAAALRLGLPNLPADDESLGEDRYEALIGLGRLDEARLAYPEALARYREALAVPLPPLRRLTAYRGIIQTQLFDDPAAAVREADTALALVQEADGSRDAIAQVHTLKGRALLNLGRYAEARIELATAMRMLGGLNLRVDYSDLVTRSDLALAALLAGDPEDARRYLAYTGSGRFREGSINLQQGNQLPPCGGDLSPDDVAVIQLWVLPDGTVGNVMPVYASRRGGSALTLARAVSQWTFDPETLGTIPMLLLAASRVEVRCTRSTPGWGLNSVLDAALAGLTEPAALPYPAGRRAIAPARAAVEAIDSATPPMRQVAALMALARHPLTNDEEQRTLSRRAFEIAGRGGMSARLIAPLAFLANENDERDFPAEIAAALQEPAIRQSAEASALLRIFLAQHYYYVDDLAVADRLASDLRGEPAIVGNSDYSAILADLSAQLARGRREAGGAGSAERCTITPRRRPLSGRAGDFPNEALRWGFEGWSLVEYRVGPDGRPTDLRNVAAYPPFVFGPAAAQTFERARFDLPGSRACFAREAVRFQIRPF